MNKIVFIRHVETDLAGTFCGHSDPDLNAAGQRRLELLLEEVAPFGIKHIYTSDLRRASRTARVIGERVGAPVEPRPGLRELHFGLWEGLRWDEIQQQYPVEAQLWASEFPTRRAPGGEPYRDFCARVEGEFHSILANAKNETLAVVTHRGILVYALTHFFGFTQNDARSRTANYGSIVIATQSNLTEIEHTHIQA